MIIQVASGTGTGPTKLSAFDAALNHVGVANYNLIKLSSVIPPKSTVKVYDGSVDTSPGKWGDRLYVVMADMRAGIPNAEAWAGIGWVQDKKTGKGLFVEHEGANEQTIRMDIRQSLEAMMAVRNVDFGDIHMKVVGRTCTHEPVCALVIAVFKAQEWGRRGRRI